MDYRMGNALAIILFAALITVTVVFNYLHNTGYMNWHWFWRFSPLLIPVILLGAWMFIWFGWGYGGWFT